MIINIKPLTVNQAWQGKKFKSPAYKQFSNDIAWLLPRNGKAPSGPIEVYYKFFLKHHATTDFDNLIKPLQDQLVQNFIIEDDRFIYKAIIEKIPSDKDYIEVTFKELTPSV